MLFMTPAKPSAFFMIAGGGGTGDSNEPPDIPNEWGEDGDGISIVEVVVEQGEA
ncbi:MAG: hypothetical protein ACYC9L_15760 [Sulfuricaulis sp.]